MTSASESSQIKYPWRLSQWIIFVMIFVLPRYRLRSPNHWSARC